MSVIAIVPYRPDQGHRDKLWAYLKGNYWTHLPHEVVVGEHLSGPFNRAKAVNKAADRAWDLAIIADNDTWVPANQLRQALMAANVTKRLSAPFDAVVELSRSCTAEILTGKTTLAGPFVATKVRTRAVETQSSILVVPRRLWDEVGGMDERCKGWGAEDNIFWHACTILGGEPIRIAGNAYHLWHVPAEGKLQGIDYKRNLNLWRRYEKARTPEQLRAVQRGERLGSIRVGRFT